jgi:hypothetical protein
MNEPNDPKALWPGGGMLAKCGEQAGAFVELTGERGCL